MTVRTERGEIHLGTLAILLAIVAAFVVPIVLMLGQRSEDEGAPIEAVEQTQDVAAEGLLQDASRAAAAYYGEHGTFVGLTPATAATYEPGLRWNARSAAVRGEVGIRGAASDGVALVTLSASGTPLCAAVGPDTAVFGSGDAASADGCVSSP